MVAPVMVRALFPMIGNCIICDSGIVLPYHDMEIGWVCAGCAGHVNWADLLLCSTHGLKRPVGKINKNSEESEGEYWKNE